MKVKVAVQEIQYFTCIKEVEMSKKDYIKYLKTGEISREIKDEVSSNGEQYHESTVYLKAEIIE